MMLFWQALTLFLLSGDLLQAVNGLRFSPDNVKRNALSSSFLGKGNNGTSITSTALQHGVSNTLKGTKSSSAASTRPPKVHYLFLVYNHINNQESWRRYFQNEQDEGRAAEQGGEKGDKVAAVETDWQAYIHCKDGYTCQMPPFEATLIPSVASTYCADLVSPMIALLREALKNAESSDQFAFFSDSTLPVKPRQYVHETLLADPTLSAFCMFPVSAWARRPMADPTQGFEVAAKHHQWVTLSYDAATKLVNTFNVNDILYQSLLSSFNLVGRVCIDEYYMFHALFETLQNAPATDFVQRTLLDKFDAQQANREASGAQARHLKAVDRCYTLACWNVPSNPVIPAIQQYLQNYGLVRYDAVTRPGTLTHASIAGLKELRKSSFLFLRKVPDSPQVLDSCESFENAAMRLLYSSHVLPALEGPAQSDLTYLTVDFQQEYFGSWTDVANEDTRIKAMALGDGALDHQSDGGPTTTSPIASTGREIKLEARSLSSNSFVWTGHGTICGRHLSLRFHDQVLDGELNDKADTIYWANGAQWRKDMSDKDSAVEKQVTAMTHHDGASPAEAVKKLPGALPMQFVTTSDAKRSIATPLSTSKSKTKTIATPVVSSFSTVKKRQATSSTSAVEKRKKTKTSSSSRDFFSYNLPVSSPGVVASPVFQANSTASL
ncbi:unnamed protein product [Amoebophrya sp. A25]|nr:unnamed protein product [Amoebophrya sp. A25]|eukprot:GSA25T00022304001.1